MLSAKVKKEASVQPIKPEKKKKPVSKSRIAIDTQKPTTSVVTNNGGPISLSEDGDEGSEYMDDVSKEDLCLW